MRALVSTMWRFPRRTVRVRLTVLYASLFLASGVALLALTDLMMARLIHASAAIRLGEVLRVTRDVVARDSLRGAARPATSHGRPVSYVARLVQAETTRTLQQQAAADLDRLLVVSGIALAVMVLVSGVLGWLVAGRVLRPLRAMTAATRQISEENLHERLASHGPDDELKDLSDTIDGLLARLEAAFATQRRFIANASHELRTPLAMMRTSLDVAEAKPEPVPRQVTTLAGKVREGLDQADRLLEELLALARAQHGVGERTETADLATIIADALGARADAITGRGLLVLRAGGPALVRGNQVLLARLAGNLIDNAVRYNEPGGRIRTETEADETSATARLVVENDGPVLDEADVRELAQPFRRLGGDRTRSASGTGLGLSIVEAIASAHGGTLRLRARPQGGLRATVELPAPEAGPLPGLALAGAVR